MLKIDNLVDFLIYRDIIKLFKGAVDVPPKIVLLKAVLVY